MSNEMKQYLSVLEEYISLCRTMLGTETAKRQALVSNDGSALEKAMTSQQTQLMQMRSLEQRRIDRQKEAGFGNASGEEILAALPDSSEEKKQLQPLLREFSSVVRDIEQQNKLSLQLAQKSLSLIALLKNDGSSGITYGPSKTRRRTPTSGSILTEKI